VDELKGRYPVVISQDLIWADMDAFQHINNAVYFRYFEDARMTYMDRAKLIEYMDRTRIGPILASTRCDFRAPLTFPDTIQVATYVEDIELKRFKMKYIVYSERLRKVAAEGEGLIVFYDYQKKVSCEIPEVILSSIKAMQHDYE